MLLHMVVDFREDFSEKYFKPLLLQVWEASNHEHLTPKKKFEIIQYNLSELILLQQYFISFL